MVAATTGQGVATAPTLPLEGRHQRRSRVEWIGRKKCE